MALGCLNIVELTLGTLLISFKVQYSVVIADGLLFASSLKLKEAMHIKDLRKPDINTSCLFCSVYNLCVT